jgi:hypothetical protein
MIAMFVAVSLSDQTIMRQLGQTRRRPKIPKTRISASNVFNHMHMKLAGESHRLAKQYNNLGFFNPPSEFPNFFVTHHRLISQIVVVSAKTLPFSPHSKWQQQHQLQL